MSRVVRPSARRKGNLMKTLLIILVLIAFGACASTAPPVKPEPAPQQSPDGVKKK